MAVLAWWLFLFGIWPLSHPSHTTFTDPVTWIDLLLHLVGASFVIPQLWRWAVSD